MTALRPLLAAVIAVLAGGLVAGGLAAAAGAAEPPELAALFPRRAAVAAPPGRLARLELPPEVLAACRPDLSDLRIVDAAGREVPFLVLEGVGPEAALEVREVVRPELLEVDRRTEGRDPGPALLHERYELSPPPEAPPGERWDLVLASGRRELVRRAEVSLTGAGPDERGLWRGSLFRLADPPRERLRIPLPPVPRSADGAAAGRLVVALEGEEGSFLEPGFRYERVREIPGAERTRVPLELLDRREAGGRTVLELARPRGLVPDRLVLETATPALERRVEVWDEGPGAVAEPLARETVLRLPGPEPLEDLAVSLAPPRGDRLRVVVLDGDSPPLDRLRVVAAVRRPALVFALPADTGDAAATLYFGGGRAHRPRYDLAALAPALPAAGAEARAAERLYDPAAVAAAELAPPADNPRFDPAPALAFALRPAAALDPAPWRWRRPLEARPSPEGLVRLHLGLEELARARADGSDLRLVDGDGRQWAYLVEAAARPEPHPLEVGAADTEDGVSRYAIALPASPATLEGITFEVAAPFFDRPFSLRAERGDEEAVLASGRLVLPPRDPRPVEVRFPAARVDALTLEVEDGSDAPLELTAATGWFPVPDLFFAAPAGDYTLLVGHPEAAAPRYELARVREVVLAVAAGEAAAAPLEENPTYRAGARWLSASGAQKLLLWGALVLAVAGLGFLTLTLARREGGG